MSTYASHTVPSVTVVDAGPQLTMENAHELLRLIQAVPPGLSPRVVVDMRQTRVMDSTGVGALVSSMRYIRQQQGGFALTNLSPEIQRMFHLMNLDNVLAVYDSVEAAAQRLSTPTSHDI
jgi:anti-sigma B factor antagonist